MAVMIGLEVYNSLGLKILNNKTKVSKIIARIDVNGRKSGEETIDTMGAKRIIAFAYPLYKYGQRMEISINGNKVSWKSSDREFLSTVPIRVIPNDVNLIDLLSYRLQPYTMEKESEVLPEKIFCIGY